ncbi:MAG: DegV family protein, partial [Atopobiaceae bacterium]|nr:DegV family protein [Atopobiaceae bacterium]
YRAGVDISTDEVVARFAQEIPKTSLPSPDDIRAAFLAAKEDGYGSAVFVGISSGLSATCDTARLVADGIPGFPVTIVDTKSIGAAAGLVVMEAARIAERGATLEWLTDELNILSTDTHVFFCVKDLEYLHKGGRIDNLTYRLGSLLNIKPIIWCDAMGFYRTYKKVRGWQRALKQEVRCLHEFAMKQLKVRVAIACTAACNLFEAAEDMIRKEIPNVAEIVRAGISPALLVHTGPDLVGMAVQPFHEVGGPLEP